MALDWIKMRNDLQTHPKVRRIASAICPQIVPDKFRAIGALHAVWCLFDAHSVDGSLRFYSPETLDSEVGVPGIARAMELVGWMTVGEDVLSLPEFDEHNGKSAKRRAEDQKRKRRVRNLSADEADEMRTREEKRREEEKKETPTESHKKSAKDRIEEFTPTEADRAWAAKKAPSVPVEIETEAWRDRVRAANYRTKQGLIADPAASWRTSFRNAEAWGTYRKKWEGRSSNEAAPILARAVTDRERELDEIREWIGAQSSAVLTWKKHGCVPADWPVAECTPAEWEAYMAHVKEAGGITLAEWRKQVKR